MRGCRALFTAFCLVLLSMAAAQAASRGISIQLKEPNGAEATVPLYGASHALVVGIDAYRDGWPRLSNAVSDARAVAAELERHGFDVTLLTDLDSDALVKALKEFFIVKGDDPDSRLFVWFAGHGHTQHGEGFLVPADAPRPGHGPGFRLKALPMRDFGTFVRLARAKHVLAVFDACFAGTVFDSQRALPSPAVTRATTLPVREFMTSGDAEQAVSDDGTFRELFIRALRGEEQADANHDGYVTGTELGLFLTDRVTNLTAQRQTPRYGKLRDKDWDRGDFVFVLPGAESRTASNAPVDANAEILFWQSIKDADDPALFQAYLDRFPDGTFAPIARTRLRSGPVPSQPTARGPHDVLKNANLRDGPSTDAAKIGLLAEGARVMVEGASGDWLRVRVAATESILASPGYGRVVAVSVAAGDAVRAGQTLVGVEEPGAVDIRKARLDAAKVALDSARQDLRRAKSLFDARAISRQAFEDAELAVRRAQAEHDRLKGEAAGDAAMAVTADGDGIVTEVRVEVGQFVRGGDPVAVVRGAETAGWVWGALLVPAPEPVPAPVAIETGFPMDPIGQEVVVQDSLPILTRPMRDAPRAGETKPGERITVVGRVRGTTFHQISRNGVVMGYLFGQISGPGAGPQPPPPPPPRLRGRPPPPRR